MRYDGYLICTDLDGTLKDSTGHISPENCAAIRRFQQNGGRFTAVTGRAYTHLAEYADCFVPNAPVCAHNGACIHEVPSGRLLYEGRLPLDLTLFDGLTALLSPCAAHITRISFPREEYSEDSLSYDEWYAKRDLLCSGVWRKGIVVFDDPAVTLETEERALQSPLAKTYSFERSWNIALEFNAWADTKGAAALRLKAMLPDVRRLVCIGDYENDRTMLRLADLGVAVANAPPEVRAVADLVTVSNNESPLARLIDSLPELGGKIQAQQERNF